MPTLTGEPASSKEKNQAGPDSATLMPYSSLGEVALHALCKKVLKGQRLLIASNRGPITYERKTETGPIIARLGSGGVVTALSALAKYTPLSWVCAALSPTDQEMANLKIPLKVENDFSRAGADRNVRLHLVSVEKSCFESYLNVISNPLLWFVQHSQGHNLVEKFTSAYILQAWRDGYLPANRQFAEAVIREADSNQAMAPFVIFHDYQLYLAPGMVRQRRPYLTLMHFTHIPWPEPKAWQMLPAELVQAICRSLLSCDIAGFQTETDARAFVQTCQEYLKQGVVVEQDEIAASKGFLITSPATQSSTRVRAYPISIDPAQVQQVYQSPAARRWREKLAAICPQNGQLIVRVDRLDPSKNIVRGFEAYEQLLVSCPELKGRVTFLALLVPTRESVAQYITYKEQTFATIERINHRFGTPDWQPIQCLYGNDYPRALTALSLADVVLINSAADGMNLVAKEMAVVNENKAALVLSRTAGAWQELGTAALGVDPFNLAATVKSLSQALFMSKKERVERAGGLIQIVHSHDLASWIGRQLYDLSLVQHHKEKELEYLPSSFNKLGLVRSQA
jgi:trehalose 6-phosphate synthase